jgi:hypothetical protein
MVAGSLGEVQEVDFGAPLHCLVIAGHMHELEEKMLEVHGLAALRARGLIKQRPPPTQLPEDATPDGLADDELLGF